MTATIQFTYYLYKKKTSMKRIKIYGYADISTEEHR